MTQQNLVVVLGYNPTGMKGGLPPQKIWKDRLEKGLELQDSLGNADFMISGGGSYEGKSEAQLMKEFMVKEFEVSKMDILLEEESRNTIENIENLKEISGSYNTVFFVSSRDHISDVQRIAAEKMDNFFTVPSDKLTLRNRLWHVYKLLKKGRI